MTKPAFLIGALIALGAGAGGCASNTAYNPPPRLDDDTRTVSCKLPPQIRRLGQHATYLAAGRIVRTNAGDCRVRGGQITELASVASDPVVAADGTMAVMIGGDGGQSACPVSGQIARLKSGSTLNVRAGPGTQHPRLDAVRNGQTIYVCDGTADEQWLGVVYPAAAGEDCGVRTPLAEGRPYTGPCRAGWVNAGWVDQGNN